MRRHPRDAFARVTRTREGELCAIVDLSRRDRAVTSIFATEEAVAPTAATGTGPTRALVTEQVA
jgi:hypothetical protein